MKTNSKPDFLDDVVDEMGADKGADDGSKYGAEMDDEDDAGDSTDESMDEDQLMAAGQVAKAFGMPNADKRKVRDALKAFLASCE